MEDVERKREEGGKWFGELIDWDKKKQREEK